MNFYKLKIYIENCSLKEKYLEHVNNHNQQVTTNFPNAGFDLFTPNKILESSEIFKLNTEIICAMFDSNNNPVSYFLYPRSSISKTTYRLANSVGIIDSGYRGNIIGVFDNLSKLELSVNIEQYSRLLQICAPNLGPIIVEIVERLEELSEETQRGSGGFGSTGL
jgi:dUTP pyrophosphatase